MGRKSTYLWRVAALVLLRSCRVSGEATVTITNDATITAAPSASFEGYYIVGTTTTPLYCASSEVFVTSANYAGCCPSTSTSCALATACSGNTVLLNSGNETACGTQQCHSLKIFPTYPAAGTAYTMPFCAGTWEADTLYRAIPMTTGLTMPLSVASGDTGNAMPTGMMMVPMPADTASNNSSSTNYGAIAGAIIGTVAVMGLILAAFWYGRRRARGKPHMDTKSNRYSGSEWSAPMYKHEQHSYSGSDMSSRHQSLNPHDRRPISRPVESMRAVHSSPRHRPTLDHDWRFPKPPSAHVGNLSKPLPPLRSKTLPSMPESRQEDWKFPSSPLVRTMSRSATLRDPGRVVHSPRGRSEADTAMSPLSAVSPSSARGPELGKSTLSHR
ncbi:hypothetical protein F5B20DRAFT_94150 [Whalleya microplaca]|nr:hypothetical protein F5B20DRAFT_94150 [Whalleya microplaca]